MQLLAVALAVAACAVVVLTAMTLLRRWDRRLRSRLDELAGHLEGGAVGTASTDTRAALRRVTAAAGALSRQVVESDRLSTALRKALEETSLGVVVLDAHGREVFANRAASSLAGAPLTEALVSDALAKLVESTEAGHSSSTVLELHGVPRRTLRVTGLTVGDGMVAALIEDVSERRRLDTVRRDLVANVGHELKTPVGALGLLAETIASESDPDVVHRLAGRMQSETARLARIIEDLLSLSRLEAEEAPRHEPAELDGVVSDAVEQVRSAAELHDVEIRVSVPSGRRVRADRRQLVAALVNLLENAVKYSHPGSAVELRVVAAGDVVDLVVEDRGVGIPAGDLDRIFERFYRVDRGRGRDSGGTGLGLSIVRHVAHNHGGEVYVESREGEGSRFTLRLPAGPGTAGAGAAEVLAGAEVTAEVSR